MKANPATKVVATTGFIFFFMLSIYLYSYTDHNNFIAKKYTYSLIGITLIMSFVGVVSYFNHIRLKNLCLYGYLTTGTIKTVVRNSSNDYSYFVTFTFLDFYDDIHTSKNVEVNEDVIKKYNLSEDELISVVFMKNNPKRNIGLLDDPDSYEVINNNINQKEK